MPAGDCNPKENCFRFCDFVTENQFLFFYNTVRKYLNRKIKEAHL